MIVTYEPIQENTERDFFWTRIFFNSDDQGKQTQVLTCISKEYLEDKFKPSKEKDKSIQWVESVENKWKTLGNQILNQDIHYDVYVETSEGEAEGLRFLLNKMR